MSVQTGVSRRPPRYSRTPAQPAPGRSPRVLLAGGLFLTTVAAVVAFLWLNLSSCTTFTQLTPSFSLVAPVSGLVFATLGLTIARRQPTNRVAWLCLTAGLGLSLANGLDLYTACAAAGDVWPGALPAAAWFAYTIWPLMILLPIFVLLPLLFPDGRFLTPRWRHFTRWFLVLVALNTLAIAVVPDFSRGSAAGGSYPLDNPLGVDALPAWWMAFFPRAANLLLVFGSLAGVVSIALRLKRSRGQERQQMKWFAYFLSTAVALQLVLFEFAATVFDPYLAASGWSPAVDLAYELVLAVVFLGFPTTIGIAVFKYRLYDIDIIIRGTLVYGTLTALLAFLYFGLVTMLQFGFTAVTGQTSPLVIVISTLAIAALFSPLRRRLQEFIDRRFYRRKYDAAQVLAEFAATTRSKVDLDELTGELLCIVDEFLQPESATLWLWPDERPRK